MSDKSKKMSTKALPGFMDLDPNEQICFLKILKTIEGVYQKFGFTPLDTPVIETEEILLAKAGGDTEKQIYRFEKGKTKMALRFDLTVPLARYAVQHYDKLVFPFRRYAISKVYRGERPQVGRFREFYQADIDIIGDEFLDPSFDAEIPSVIYNIFNKLGFDKFTIRVNNRKILNGFFKSLQITDYSTQVMQAIDKLEKVGKEAVKIDLNSIGISSEKIESIFNFIEITGNSDEVIAGLKNLSVDDPEFNEGVEELLMVISMMRTFGIPEDNFEIDLTIARGLDYYTGTVYETRLDEYPEIGSVCSGGRYDDLASNYTTRNLPGVGISIGVTRLFDQLKRKGFFESKKASTTNVLILPLTEDLTYAIKLANELREKEISTEVFFDNKKTKFKKKLDYANKLGIRHVVFIGEKEIKNQLFTLKDFYTGDQENLTFSEIIEKMNEVYN